MKHLPDIIPNTSPFTKQFLDLLRKIFIYDPAERITAKEALNHPWFREIAHADDGTEAIKIRKQRDAEDMKHRLEMQHAKDIQPRGYHRWSRKGLWDREGIRACPHLFNYTGPVKWAPPLVLCLVQRTSVCLCSGTQRQRVTIRIVRVWTTLFHHNFNGYNDKGTTYIVFRLDTGVRRRNRRTGTEFRAPRGESISYSYIQDTQAHVLSRAMNHACLVFSTRVAWLIILVPHFSQILLWHDSIALMLGRIYLLNIIR